MHIRNKIPRLILTVFFSSLVAYAFSLASARAANFIDRTVCAPITLVLSALNSLFSFSVFELFCVSSPLALFLILRYISRGKGSVHRRFFAVLVILSLIPTLYFITLGIPQNAEGTTVLPQPTEDEISRCVSYLVTHVNQDSSLLENRVSLDFLRSECNENHPKTLHGYPLRHIKLPLIKHTVFPKIASRLGILAYFSFLTAEIHINGDMPEYMKPFTAAHEYAHFLGITSEAEAGYFAFLTCSMSAEPAVRYSGNLCALEYLLSDIAGNNVKMYTEVVNSLDDRVKNDIINANEYFSRYSRRVAYKVADGLNSAYLSAFDKHGKNSYSLLSRYVASHVFDA